MVRWGHAVADCTYQSMIKEGEKEEKEKEKKDIFNDGGGGTRNKEVFDVYFCVLRVFVLFDRRVHCINVKILYRKRVS